MGAAQERNTRIVCRFFGFDGTGRKTLEEVGAENNITRERVRQITTRFSRSVRGKRVHVPLVRLARSIIEHELPALERDVIEVLRKESIITGEFDCTGILAAVSLFDKPTPLRVTNIEGLGVVGNATTLDSLKRAPAIARAIVSAFGCGHIEHVMGDIEVADERGGGS
jgi:Sigma-70, region 4